MDLLADRLGLDAVLAIVRHLRLSPAVGLADRARHRLGHDVGVHDHLALDVARRAADRLNQRGPATQIPFFVGVEDADERDLRQIEPFAQQIDADEHVEDAGSQVAQDRDPLERVDLAVQVSHPQSVLDEKVGQILGHLLRQRRDQHALLARRAQSGSLPLDRRLGCGSAAPRLRDRRAPSDG